MFFVDSTNSLVTVDLTDTTTQETLISDLFEVEGISNASSPMIGLHYHSERNVLIAAGIDADGINKLLIIIAPETANYAQSAQ